MTKAFRFRMLTVLCTGGLAMAAGAASADHKDCTKDLNEDGAVDSQDMMIIEDALGTREGVGKYDERADLNQDGFVTISDKEIYPHCRN